MGMESRIELFHIPQNIAKYIADHDGSVIELSICHADADDGYAHVLWPAVSVKRLTRTCIHCGYDPIWSPDDSNSRCRRHAYNSWRYDTVFSWSGPNKTDQDLASAFDTWQQAQPSNGYVNPVKYMRFGQFDWSPAPPEVDADA